MRASKLRTLIFSGFLSLSRLGTQAQESVAVCDTRFAWMNNGEGQQPCLVAAYLIAPCLVSPLDTVVLSLAASGITAYPPPGPSEVYHANTCTCSSVLYSLLSACGVCQGFENFYSWSQWIASCPVNMVSVGAYPDNFSSIVSIPQWAFQNVSVGNSFDVYTVDATAAKSLRDVIAPGSPSNATDSTRPEPTTSLPTSTFIPLSFIPLSSIPSSSIPSSSIPPSSILPSTILPSTIPITASSVTYTIPVYTIPASSVIYTISASPTTYIIPASSITFTIPAYTTLSIAVPTTTAPASSVPTSDGRSDALHINKKKKTNVGAIVGGVVGGVSALLAAIAAAWVGIKRKACKTAANASAAVGAVPDATPTPDPEKLQSRAPGVVPTGQPAEYFPTTLDANPLRLHDQGDPETDPHARHFSNPARAGSNLTLSIPSHATPANPNAGDNVLMQY